MAKNKYKKALQNKDKKVGRQRKVNYEKEVLPFLHDIKDLIINGYNNKEIAALIGCNESTLYVWRKKYKEFDDIFQCDEFKLKLKDELMVSLYKRAVGMMVQESSTMMTKKGPMPIESERYVYSDKAAELVLRNILGDVSANKEINITFNDGQNSIDIKFGTNDDEGDFDESR